MRGSDLFVQSLVQAGVKYVFGMSGHSTTAILDSISREPSIRFILAKHENTSVSMADAIARVTHQPVVVLSHSGPSAANMVVGIGSAFRDSSPVVMVTCNEEQSRLGRDVMNGWDQLTPFKSITKWSTRATAARDIPQIMRSAFVRSRLGRPGPVQVDMPLDVAETELGDFSSPKAPAYQAYSSKVRPDPDLAAKIVEGLLGASKPMILAGAGINWSVATPEMVQFAELTGVAVANTTNGRGVFPEDHPQFIGTPGRWGHRTASEALKESDFVLAIGSRFSDVATGNWTLIDPSATLAQVDIDPAEIARQYPVDFGVIADCRMFLLDAIAIAKPLVAKGGAPKPSPRAKALNQKYVEERDGQLVSGMDSTPIQTRRLLKEVSDVIRHDAIISVGGGRHSHFVGHQMVMRTPRSALRSGGFGAIGFAFPAALGAKLACPDRQVVCLVGDGDFSQSMEGLETAAREKINLVTVVFNDGAYTSVKIIQHHHYGSNIGVDFTNPDFAKFADICGGKGYRVERPGDIRPALEAALKENRPTLLDVIIDPNEKTGYGVFSK